MPNKKMKYYTLWYRLNYQSHYAIWCSDNDGGNYLVSKEDIILYFLSKTELKTYAKTNNIKIEKEIPILHNLDKVRIWLHNIKSEINCSNFLAAWNLFDDITSSVTVSKKMDKLINHSYYEIYNKLYSGSNIMVSRKSNRRYYPEWDVSEKQIIKKIMQGGFKLVKGKLRKHA